MKKQSRLSEDKATRKAIAAVVKQFHQVWGDPRKDKARRPRRVVAKQAQVTRSEEKQS